MTENRFVIRISSLDTSAVLEKGSKPGDLAKVVFTIGQPPWAIDIPIYFAREQFDDRDIIPIAQSFLASFAQTLASQTANWRMDDAAVEALRIPGK